jgi:hypothetical protein
MPRETLKRRTRESQSLLVDQLRDRFAQCGLELHPQKTRVVYCKDADRRGDYPDTLDDLARMFNATIRGWVNYYGAFYKSALYPTLRQIDRKLVLWATRKFKRLRGHRRRASQLERIARKHTRLFAHWPLLWGQASVGRAG